MNMPGFSAEASLYNNNRRYQMARTVTQTDGPVQAAFDRGRGCYAQCLGNWCVGYDDPYCEGNCRCICYGHPGVTCELQ